MELLESDDAQKLLSLISSAYEDFDEDNYLLERSLEISFNELKLYQLEQKNSYESHLNAMVSAMPDMMFLNNSDGKFLEAFVKENQDLITSQEIVGKFYKDVFPNYISEFFSKNLEKTLKHKTLHVAEFMMRDDNRYYEARFMVLNHKIDGKESVITLVRNITKAKRIQEKLHFIATHDDLTKLPNRFYFEKKLKKSLKVAKREQHEGGLLFLDIDNFKVVNDNLGHNIGDYLLIAITNRLKELLGKNEFLARFGGDEFVLIVPKATDEKLKLIAFTILQQFIKPFQIEKYLLEMTTSIGICTFPNSISSYTQLLKQADIAMYHAKNMGKNRYAFFTKALAEKSYDEFMLEVNLKKAINNNAFYLVYQPQISLDNNSLIGVEALIRWDNNGLVPPSKFIPLAEQCGYIEQVSDWVIEEVCRQINLWKQEDVKVPRVSINLSRRELSKTNLLQRIVQITKQYKVESTLLEFEVTETAIMSNREITFKNITALQTHGFLVSIDDFGTGYSSLSNLTEFFFDKLKIDKSFIFGIGKIKESELIIKATIAIAQSLNLKVIAEGVETKEHFHFLKKNNCDEVQGYFCARPIRGSEIKAFHFP